MLEERADNLQTANVQAKIEIDHLNSRLRAVNKQKLADIARAAARVKAAHAATETVKAQKVVIAEELAMAKFSILEAIRDDEDYADWAFYPAHPSIWLQISAADSGIPAE